MQHRYRFVLAIINHISFRRCSDTKIKRLSQVSTHIDAIKKEAIVYVLLTQSINKNKTLDLAFKAEYVRLLFTLLQKAKQFRLLSNLALFAFVK